MTRSNSASVSPLMMMVMACFLVLASAEEKSSVVNQDRQSRQIVLPPESYHFSSGFPLPYFDSYGQPLMVPVGNTFPDPNVPYIYSLSSSGNSEMERAFQNQAASLTITPAETECLLENLPTEGSARCRLATQARRGDITMKFTKLDQIANFAITAPTNYNIKLTCSDITNVNAFTQSVQITATTDTPVTEKNYMNIAVRSTESGDSLKCSWESSRQ
ncbi:uncharacterized protein LOC130700781 isoform X2 [Daphnia carinata]|uniref:uncharacterized protein LOC130700781 isoform X2 n=1 Tax=Daphnia carinata TaxID=120202 RepID=UPI002579CF28|nr:uncharacterized protein LOC130700781 isoform X2 [Daphnia carinata]